MPTSYPAALDTTSSLATISAGQTLAVADHDEKHNDVRDAVLALEAKVGADGSAVSATLDYRVTALEAPSVTIFGGDGQAVAQAKIDASAAGAVISFVGILPVNATPLRLKSGRSYVSGSGMYAGVKMANGANLDCVVCSEDWYANSATVGDPIGISGLLIDANQANQTGGVGHGLIIMNWQSRIMDCWAFNTRGDGFRLTVLSRNGSTISTTCIETYFVRCRTNGAIGAACVRVEDPTGSKATDGWILHCGLFGGDFGVLVDSASGWLIDGNHTYVQRLDGIHLEKCYATRCTNNYVELFGTQGSGVGYYFGITLSMLAGRASHLMGNTVSQPNNPGGTQVGLKVHAGAGQACRAVVGGNAYDGPGSGTGMSFEHGVGGSMEVALGPNAMWGAGSGLDYTIQSGSVVFMQTLAGPTEMVQQAAPSAAPAGRARVFARTTGGKGQVAAIFPTGAIQGAATEP